MAFDRPCGSKSRNRQQHRFLIHGTPSRSTPQRLEPLVAKVTKVGIPFSVVTNVA